MMQNKLGNIEIKPQALAVIVSISTSEVEGVSKLVGNFKNNTLEKMGKKEYSKGVKLSFDDKELNVEISCKLKSGYPVSQVAGKIQYNVRNTLFNMTEIKAKNVNVNIVGIDY
ncbi:MULTISPECIES: Asp23/Gls24 family envelope stress response protein [unclassified Gemella]|uniref:Asp23/Gls24 family envelope stress response protein n=1 Tax=unclassified Gemella TaxID=2624949 RepID=UPI001C059601|nr:MULTISPECIES: Asp23/Gls24 family envelope stress response protein [unclassified Gemella]MBU0278268.1 Asp23/Gls24 family envelope stress response protein [Gemella sp. zg-1178]QWQ38225.1 Asp23/Gls24 family envelope stress response protein [Gemella sp. zg-570]